MLHKKHYATLFLSLLFAIASAQVNLREGIVITLQGDTLHGQIDYRTDRINSEQCVFLANGASATTTYLPGQIEGYRFLDNGRYYMSNSTIFTDTDTKIKPCFLELLVRGQISVYYWPDNEVQGTALFYFVRNDGSVATVRYNPNTYYKKDDSALGIDRRIKDPKQDKAKRAKLSDANMLLKGSKKAQKMLFDREINIKNATKIAMTYNEEMCPDGQCEIFNYRNKKTPKAERELHWTVSLGFTNFHFKECKDDIGGFGNSNNVLFSKTYSATNISIGANIDFPRVIKGLQLQLQIDDTFVPGDAQFKGHDISLKVGPAYKVPSWRIQPFIGAGAAVYTPFYKLNIGEDEKDITSIHDFGAYFNAGVLFPCKKRGAFVFNAQYSIQKRRKAIERYDISKLSFNLGYQF